MCDRDGVGSGFACGFHAPGMGVCTRQRLDQGPRAINAPGMGVCTRNGGLHPGWGLIRPGVRHQCTRYGGLHPQRGLIRPTRRAPTPTPGANPHPGCSNSPEVVDSAPESGADNRRGCRVPARGVPRRLGERLGHPHRRQTAKSNANRHPASRIAGTDQHRDRAPVRHPQMLSRAGYSGPPNALRQPPQESWAIPRASCWASARPVRSASRSEPASRRASPAVSCW